MSDILPVCLQNFLYCRKSELREQIKQVQSNQLSSGVKSAAYSYALKSFYNERIFREMSLIHRYQNNGYNIVLDINSGCIHLVDLGYIRSASIYGRRIERRGNCFQIKGSFPGRRYSVLLFPSARNLRSRECSLPEMHMRM